jgi:two-component system, NarL family, invasion response regulator UvrY
MPKKRVLLVDDNPIVRSFVRKLFELEADFELSGEAGDARDAIEKARNLSPDLIILDLSMPDMTGLATAPLLRKLLPEARIILFTVHEEPELQELARAAGIDAVVSKYQAVSQLVVQAQALLAPKGRLDHPKIRNAS